MLVEADLSTSTLQVETFKIVHIAHWRNYLWYEWETASKTPDEIGTWDEMKWEQKGKNGDSNKDQIKAQMKKYNV